MAAWIDHLWQSTLLAVVVLLGLAAVGRWLTAAARRALLAVTLVQFLVPAAWFSAALSRLSPPTHRWLAAKTITIQMGLPVFRHVVPALAHRSVWLGLVLGVWLAGFGLVVGLAWIQTRRLRRRLSMDPAAPSPAFQERLAIAAARAGLPRAPLCQVVSTEDSPGVLGIVRPILFFPAELAAALTAEELDAILLHETIHLARRDNLGSALQTVLIGLHWYNPVAWFVSRQLQLETEMSCDERVLALIGEPEIYLSAIAKTVRHSLGLLAPGFSPAGSTPVGLRLGNILSFRPKPLAGWLAPVAFLAVLGGILSSGYAGSVTSGSRWPARDVAAVSLDSWGASNDPAARSLRLQLVDPRDEPEEAASPDVMPMAIDRPAPIYPLAPRLAGVSGSAAVDYTVGRDGQVRDVSVASSDREDFAWAAAQAVQRWRYVPAQRDGSPMAVRLQVKVIFSAQTPLPAAVLPADRPVVVSWR
jgi:TonB family protein